MIEEIARRRAFFHHLGDDLGCTSYLPYILCIERALTPEEWLLVHVGH